MQGARILKNAAYKKYAAMIHPVESALPSRASRIQQGGDEAQHSKMIFYEAVRVDMKLSTLYSNRSLNVSPFKMVFFNFLKCVSP